jgi:hypothetical protein
MLATPFTLHLTPYALNPTPQIRGRYFAEALQGLALYDDALPQVSTLKPETSSLDPEPQHLNPKP